MNGIALAVVETIALVMVWGVVALVQSGWGFLLLRGVAPQSRPTGLMAFWVGFGALVVFLQIWHLFLPINALTAIVAILIGVVGVGVKFSRWRERLAEVWSGWTIVLLGVAVVAANFALRPMIFYDNGLYHLPTIQWLLHYPIVPGVANVYGPLAFNNSYFLVVALWEGFFAGFWGAQVLNGVLMMAVVVQAVNALHHAIAERRSTPIALLSLLLLYPLFTLTFEPLANYLSGPTTDYAVWMVTLVLAIEAFAILETQTVERAHYFLVALLAWVLITLKLSGAVFAVGILGVVTLLLWRRGEAVKRLVAVAVVVGVVTMAPWLLRSALMTGYIVYPTTVGGLPVEWRVADEQALEDTNDVRSWSRYPVVGSVWQDVLDNWDWFPSWQVNFWNTRGIKLSLVVGSVAWGGVVLVSIWKRQMPRTLYHLLWWTVPTIVSVIFWFFSAPSPRYIPISFWLVALGGVVALCALFPAWERSTQTLLGHKITPLLAGLGIMGLVLFAHGTEWQSTRAPMPTVEVTPFTTFSGLILYVPVGDDLCWNAPVPCTPYPNANLRLREADNIGAGFTIMPLNQ